MTNTSIIVNTRKAKLYDPKANGVSSDPNATTCVHTVKAEDLRIMRPILGQGGLSMVMKLKG